MPIKEEYANDLQAKITQMEADLMAMRVRLAAVKAGAVRVGEPVSERLQSLSVVPKNTANVTVRRKSRGRKSPKGGKRVRFHV